MQTGPSSSMRTRVGLLKMVDFCSFDGPEGYRFPGHSHDGRSFQAHMPAQAIRQQTRGDSSLDRRGDELVMLTKKGSITCITVWPAVCASCVLMMAKACGASIRIGAMLFKHGSELCLSSLLKSTTLMIMRFFCFFIEATEGQCIYQISSGRWSGCHQAFRVVLLGGRVFDKAANTRPYYCM